MSVAVKKKIATFMNYPTEALAGRITDELAEKKYNDWNEIIPVVQKIRQVLLKQYYGFYHDWVPVLDAKLLRLKTNELIPVIDEFLDWYNKQN